MLTQSKFIFPRKKWNCAACLVGYCCTTQIQIKSGTDMLGIVKQVSARFINTGLCFLQLLHGKDPPDLPPSCAPPQTSRLLGDIS